jgi:uncharacterized membrane protein required for colicin V production
VEFFKLLGTTLAIYLGLHYYTFLAGYLAERFNISLLPLEFLELLCFLILAISGYLIFLILRQAITHFIKSEAAPRLNRWGGLLLGAVRGLFFLGIVMFCLAISTFNYLNTSVHRSCFGSRIFNLAPQIYTKLWNGVMSKFMSGEKFNHSVLQLQESFKS